jgi:hypothetical protein
MRRDARDFLFSLPIAELETAVLHSLPAAHPLPSAQTKQFKKIFCSVIFPKFPHVARNSKHLRTGKKVGYRRQKIGRWFFYSETCADTEAQGSFFGSN